MPDRDPLEHPRVTLPKNLSEALKRLGDAELETLLREVIAEAERRGVGRPVHTAPPRVPAPKFQARQIKRSGCRQTFPRGRSTLSRLHIGRHEATGNRPDVPVSQSVVNSVLKMPAKSKKYTFDQGLPALIGNTSVSLETSGCNGTPYRPRLSVQSIA